MCELLSSFFCIALVFCQVQSAGLPTSSSCAAGFGAAEHTSRRGAQSALARARAGCERGRPEAGLQPEAARAHGAARARRAASRPRSACSVWLRLQALPGGRASSARGTAPSVGVVLGREPSRHAGSVERGLDPRAVLAVTACHLQLASSRAHRRAASGRDTAPMQSPSQGASYCPVPSYCCQVPARLTRAGGALCPLPAPPQAPSAHPRAQLLPPGPRPPGRGPPGARGLAAGARAEALVRRR